MRFETRVVHAAHAIDPTGSVAPPIHLSTTFARDPEGTRRAPTARGHPVSGSLSPPSSGCFSPFPHGTGSLSVVEEYLGLEGGPPMFGQGFTCPALLEDLVAFYPYGAVTRYGAPFQTLPVLSRRPLAWSAFARHY